MKKNEYMGQKILFRTHIPQGNWAKGKEYFMMEDRNGTVYLAKVGDNGLPDFS